MTTHIRTPMPAALEFQRAHTLARLPMPAHSHHCTPLHTHTHARARCPQMMYVFFSSCFSCLMSDGDSPCHPLPQHNDNTHTHAHPCTPTPATLKCQCAHALARMPTYTIARYHVPLHAHPPTCSHTHHWPVRYTAQVMGHATHGTAGGVRQHGRRAARHTAQMTGSATRHRGWVVQHMAWAISSTAHSVDNSDMTDSVGNRRRKRQRT